MGDSTNITLILILTFVGCLLITHFSPSHEVKGRGMVASVVLFMAVCYSFSPWILLVLAGLIGLLILALIVGSKYGETINKRDYARVSQYLPEAIDEEIMAVIKQIRREGKNLTDFRMQAGVVVTGPPEDPLALSPIRTWMPLSKPYIYEKEADYINAAYPMLITSEELHKLCSYLYFNWIIERLEANEHTYTLTLTKRDEVKTLQFSVKWH